MYNVSCNFSSAATNDAIDTIKQLIDAYPYSYYLLYEIKKWMSNYSNEQLTTFIARFNKDVQQSATIQEMKKRMAIRNTKRLSTETTLLTKDDRHEKIIDGNVSVNMLILWASWCGPCRKEITILKDLHRRFADNKNFRMVSISLDANKEDWEKAMQHENMLWQQLWVTPDRRPYQQEIFGFDGYIPTTIFTDNQGNVFKKYVGYDDNSLHIYSELISNQLP